MNQATLVRKVMPSTNEASRRMQSRMMAVAESPQMSADVENEALNTTNYRELWYKWDAPPDVITNIQGINYAMFRCEYRDHDRDDPPTTPLYATCGC